jgi:hypothetical protein
MINKLRMAMLNEANKSRNNPEQWYRDLKVACDFIKESE